MDNVLRENLTYFENEYVFYLDGFDKNKGPGDTKIIFEGILRLIYGFAWICVYLITYPQLRQ